VDPSIGLLRQARMPKVQGVAEFLPFKDSSFDAVISVTAIHNFDDVEKGLLEILRVGNNRFSLTVLRKSQKSAGIGRLVSKHFKVNQTIQEKNDAVYLCSRKGQNPDTAVPVPKNI
jgi:ubiquinone/menaquinone biosynthesis C-methylase UbiE